ncbi:hypothetical protein ES702_00744 [subsurface metagenome]
MILRKCRKCGLEAHTKEDLELFVKDKQRRFGRDNICKKCKQVRRKILYKRRKWDLNVSILRKCRFCGLEAHNKEELKLFVKNKFAIHGRANECKTCANKYSRRRRAEIRLIVLKHYGGDPPKCACCGEKHLEFLTIDHINGGGRKHEIQIKKQGYRTVTEWLYRNNFPKGFRVLCWNCNSCLGTYGYCPHQKKGN